MLGNCPLFTVNFSEGETVQEAGEKSCDMCITFSAALWKKSALIRRSKEFLTDGRT